MTIGEAPAAIKKAVDESVREVNHKAMGKAFRVSNAMRNSVIEVLTNESVAPPKSPPGMISGFLRRAWKTGVRNKGGAGSAMSIVAFADAKAYYAGYLEDGTEKMEARPFVEPILEDVEPKVGQIFADL